MNDQTGYAQMLQLVADLPEQLKTSATLPGLDQVVPPQKVFNRILLCGMGGSAIAGDLVQPLLSHQATDLTVWRQNTLPHWVDEQTLVLAQSYSGNTDETLAACTAAAERGCSLLALTSGGELARWALGQTDMSAFPWVQLPGGLPPRAALGLGLGALIHTLGRLGLIKDPIADIQSACGQLVIGAQSRLHHMDTSPGPADPEDNPVVGDVARALAGRIPVIYTAGAEAHGVGRRWCAQLNENSKMPATMAEFPELNHNDLVGWVLPEPLRGLFVLLILQGKHDDSSLGLRVAETQRLLADDIPMQFTISSTGETPLARIMSLVQYGDALSCHLAWLNQVDPLPVERIDRLKKALATGRKL